MLPHREFWCPMCRQLANTVLPILPDAIGCTDPDRLVPNTGPALVRHVGDVLRAPYHKQVTSSSRVRDLCLQVVYHSGNLKFELPPGNLLEFNGSSGKISV